MYKAGTLILALIILVSCETKHQGDNKLVFAKSNVMAWCVVPFDSLERGPQERATMLKELGITKIAYDWREKHLPTFPDEIKALKDNQIELTAVWFWIATPEADQLDSANQVMFNMVKENNIKTDFWIGISKEFFDGLTDEQKLQKGVEAVRSLHKMAAEIGCTINLYNHGDWFGEPDNQIRIIEKSGLNDAGIIYSFHHAHSQIKDFPARLDRMMPYLKAININGMKADGPQILPVGQGDSELEMLKTIKASGYNGPIGILGHIAEKDVKKVLEGNLQGLKKMLGEMGETEALSTY
jgi:sugar phosphate isomerase/epimerase